MAKFKPVKKNQQGGPPKAGAIPCAILIITGIVLLSLLFWAALSSGIK
jgi:hypothetical protein